MTSEFEDIYSRFFLRVEDYNIVGLDTNLVNEMMNGWMKSVLSQPYIRRLFDTLTFDEDIEQIEYTMKYPISEDEDKDFVEELIALGMVAEWVSPKYHSTLLTS